MSIDELEQAYKLKKKGVISEEEFEAKKKQILSQKDTPKNTNKKAVIILLSVVIVVLCAFALYYVLDNISPKLYTEQQIKCSNDINPMSGCLFAFIQMPLFFAFLESLNRIPAVFEGTLFGFNLGTSPFNALFGGSFDFNHFAASFSNGDFIYLLLPIIVGATTFFSFKLNSGLNTTVPDQAKQMKIMMNILLIFIIVASFTMSTSIIIYWITGSLFTIIQSVILRRKKHANSKERKSK